mmetsp:Transcript_9442/g.8983  ORF Transcript_9442/g.8983 Transcript_9442/m.8983 type:complete len:215 (+) Transcript_9442:523-1167(+)
MTAPARGANTDETQIHITWADFDSAPGNGGATLSSYHLQWDSGTSGVTWTTLIGLSPYSTALTYTLTTGVSAGQSYQFRVRVKNALGWGDYSDSTSILCGNTPDQMTGVTTSIDSATGGIKIEWDEPFSGGLPLTSYFIEIEKSGTGTWFEDTDDCDGSSATIITNRYCVIPMDTLTGATYAYLFQEVVIARVSALNTLGAGATDENTAGAQIR